MKVLTVVATAIITVVSFGSFSATQEQLEQRRSQVFDNMTQGYKDGIDAVVNSERTDAIIETGKYTASSIAGVLSESGSHAVKVLSDDFCHTMEENSDKIIAQTWFSVDTGQQLAQYAKSGDKSAQNLVAMWSKGKLFKTSPRVSLSSLNTQIDKEKSRFYYYPKASEFPEYWSYYWNKELTVGVGTYRCIRDASADVNLQTLVYTTIDYMASKGHTEYQQNFVTLVESFN